MEWVLTCLQTTSIRALKVMVDDSMFYAWKNHPYLLLTLDLQRRVVRRVGVDPSFISSRQAASVYYELCWILELVCIISMKPVFPSVPSFSTDLADLTETSSITSFEMKWTNSGSLELNEFPCFLNYFYKLETSFMNMIWTFLFPGNSFLEAGSGAFNVVK